MLHNYLGYRNFRSFCNLDLTILPSGAAYVICTEHPDNLGTSVINRAEFLTTKACRENAGDSTQFSILFTSILCHPKTPQQGIHA